MSDWLSQLFESLVRLGPIAYFVAAFLILGFIYFIFLMGKLADKMARYGRK